MFLQLMLVFFLMLFDFLYVEVMVHVIGFICECHTFVRSTNHFILRRGVVVITTAQLHSTKSELRFCAGSNPARGVSEICDGENF